MRYRRQDDRRTEGPRTRRRVICRFFDLQIFGLTSRFRFFTENQDREVNSYIRGLNRGRNPPENTPETALSESTDRTILFFSRKIESCGHRIQIVRSASRLLGLLFLIPTVQLGNSDITLDRAVIEAIFQHVLVRLANQRSRVNADQGGSRRNPPSPSNRARAVPSRPSPTRTPWPCACSAWSRRHA